MIELSCLATRVQWSITAVQIPSDDLGKTPWSLDAGGGDEDGGLDKAISNVREAEMRRRWFTRRKPVNFYILLYILL